MAPGRRRVLRCLATARQSHPEGLYVYPQVEKYFETFEGLQTAFSRLIDDKRRATEEATRANPQQRHELWETYYAAEREASVKYTADRREARQQLATDLKGVDELGVWLLTGEEVSEGYDGYVDDVLKLLPASLEEVTAYARRQQWCNVFDRFARQAKAAGVFGPQDAVERLKEELKEYLEDEAGDYAIRHVLCQLDEVLKARQAAQLERIAEVWKQVEASSPNPTSYGSAGALFARAAEAVVTGQGFTAA